MAGVLGSTSNPKQKEVHSQDIKELEGYEVEHIYYVSVAGSAGGEEADLQIVIPATLLDTYLLKLDRISIDVYGDMSAMPISLLMMTRALKNYSTTIMEDCYIPLTGSIEVAGGPHRYRPHAYQLNNIPFFGKWIESSVNSVTLDIYFMNFLGCTYEAWLRVLMRTKRQK